MSSRLSHSTESQFDLTGAEGNALECAFDAAFESMLDGRPLSDAIDFRPGGSLAFLHGSHHELWSWVRHDGQPIRQGRRIGQDGDVACVLLLQDRPCDVASSAEHFASWFVWQPFRELRCIAQAANHFVFGRF